MTFDDIKWFEPMGEGRWHVWVRIQDRYSSDWITSPIDCRFDSWNEAERFIVDEIMTHQGELLDKVYEVGEYSDDDMVWCEVYVIDEEDTLPPDVDDENYWVID